MQNQHPFIAILGGSFDPIHNSHIQMAQIVQREIEDTEIYFTPCGQPVHREKSKTPTTHRLAMLKLAIANYVHFHLDTYEIDSSKPSYTISTLQHFRQRFPNHPIGFIMGMDTFLSLDSAWGENWQNLVNYAHLLVLPRAGVSSLISPALECFLKQREVTHQDFLHKELNGGIMLLKETPAFISSTAIRQKLAARENVTSLLPEAVYDYIQQHQLYR